MCDLFIYDCTRGREPVAYVVSEETRKFLPLLAESIDDQPSLIVDNYAPLMCLYVI